MSNTSHENRSNDLAKGDSSDSPVDNENREIENIRTISRVPGNPNYYEKDGLRTEGDGMDHTHYNTHSIGFIMTMLGCSFALAGSQIVPLLYLTLSTTISQALNASSLLIWMFSAIIVAMGVLAPFVGPMADLFGRKTLFIIGLAVSVIGAVVCAATPNAGGFIAGQVLMGFGAVIQELLAIAVASEIVPTAKRPMYAALILCAILPWSPGTLYANFIASASWRWVGCALAIWFSITLVIIFVFYRPPPRVNSMGLSKKDLVKRIDFVGGFLITAGLVLFLVGLNYGGQPYPWVSAHVLTFLIIGACLFIAFGVWEFFFAPYPLFPRRIVHAPRPFFCMLFVIFAAGINYVPLVVFWPIESISVYGADLHQNGINTLPIGTCILGGAILSALLIGTFKNHVTLLMTLFCIMQTVGAACMVVIDPHDIRTAWAPVVLSLIGVGGVLVPNQVIITVITPDDLIASVTALTVGLRSQAQVIGLAIFYNRFVHQVAKNAYTTIAPAMIEAGVFNVTLITDITTGLTAMPLEAYVPLVPQLRDPTAFEAVRMAAIDCFSGSFKLVWYITIAFGVPACIVAAAMGDVSQYMDNHVAVVL